MTTPLRAKFRAPLRRAMLTTLTGAALALGGGNAARGQVTDGTGFTAAIQNGDATITLGSTGSPVTITPVAGPTTGTAATVTYNAGFAGVIATSTTVVGNGSTIQGGGATPFFIVSPANETATGGVARPMPYTVTISDLTVSGGTSQGGAGGGAGLGGALFVGTGAGVTLNNVNFTGNSAVGGSGGDASRAGGGIGGGGGAGFGGAIFVQSGASLTIAGNSTFSGNTATGGTTIDAGTLRIGDGTTDGSIAGDITDDAALVFNPTGAAAYAGDITGSGSLTKTGAGTLTLSGIDSYNGRTIVSGGTLAVTGLLTGISGVGSYIGGTLLVQSFRGTLGGAGTLIGNVTVSGNGTLAPGDLAALHIQGNLTLQSTARTVITIASPGSYDQIAVTGTAALGGTLVVDPVGGYAPHVGDSFTFLTATTVTGAFDAVQNGLGNAVKFTLSYDPADVGFTLAASQGSWVQF